jgi:hypothetical protein
VPADPPRLLHRRSHHGYTSDPATAMFDEPEAVSEEDQEWITSRVRRVARETQLARWRTAREQIDESIAMLYAQRLERPVEREVRSLRRQLERLDRLLAGDVERVGIR